MSYISTIGLLDDTAAGERANRPGAMLGGSAPAGGVLRVVGGVLAGVVEGVVFLTVTGGLSLVFCGLVAGV